MFAVSMRFTPRSTTRRTSALATSRSRPPSALRAPKSAWPRTRGDARSSRRCPPCRPSCRPMSCCVPHRPPSTRRQSKRSRSALRRERPQRGLAVFDRTTPSISSTRRWDTVSPTAARRMKPAISSHDRDHFMWAAMSQAVCGPSCSTAITSTKQSRWCWRSSSNRAVRSSKRYSCAGRTSRTS